MNTLRSQLSLAAILALTGAALAQNPVETSLTESLLIPIHTGETDPVGGAYGTWAAGPDYKGEVSDSHENVRCWG